MAYETWVIIVNDEDGRTFSVRESDPRATGREPGWTVEGPETDDSFVVKGVPAPKKPRKRPAAKNATPIAEGASSAPLHPDDGVALDKDA